MRSNFTQLRTSVCAVLMTMAAFATAPQAASATLLAGWHEFFDADAGALSPDDLAPDVTATLSHSTGGFINGAFNVSSTDADYGTLAGASTANNGGILNDNNEYIELVITNTGSLNLQLDTIHFDLLRINGSVPDEITVTYESGDLGASATLGTVSFGTGGASFVEDYTNDVDFSLAPLADQTLASGESATFRLTANDDGADGSRQGIDHVAFSGSFFESQIQPAPEPSAFALAAFGLIGLVARRRRRR